MNLTILKEVFGSLVLTTVDVMSICPQWFVHLHGYPDFDTRAINLLDWNMQPATEQRIYTKLLVVTTTSRSILVIFERYAWRSALIPTTPKAIVRPCESAMVLIIALASIGCTKWSIIHSTWLNVARHNTWSRYYYIEMWIDRTSSIHCPLEHARSVAS